MPTSDRGPAFDAALKALLQHLRDQAYEFITVTPLSHVRVLANRRGRPGNSLRDAFGWSLLFPASVLPADVLSLLLQTGVILREGGLYRSQVRVSSLGQVGCTYTYTEIDPDVFGEELERPVYRHADRIAAVGLVAVKPETP